MRRCNNILYITAFFNLEFGGCVFVKIGHTNSLWTLWAQAARGACLIGSEAERLTWVSGWRGVSQAK